jgi:hypothetical protein
MAEQLFRIELSEYYPRSMDGLMDLRHVRDCWSCQTKSADPKNIVAPGRDHELRQSALTAV